MDVMRATRLKKSMNARSAVRELSVESLGRIRDDRMRIRV